MFSSFLEDGQLGIREIYLGTQVYICCFDRTFFSIVSMLILSTS